MSCSWLSARLPASRPARKRYGAWGGRALLGLACGGLLAVVAVFNPTEWRFYPRCPFQLVTGLNCPGCGSLRALHELLRGHWVSAFALNPLLMISLPFIFYCLAVEPALDPRRRVTYHPAMPVAVGVVMVLYWVLRNIPVAPFTLLAPH